MTYTQRVLIPCLCASAILLAISVAFAAVPAGDRIGVGQRKVDPIMHASKGLEGNRKLQAPTQISGEQVALNEQEGVQGHVDDRSGRQADVVTGEVDTHWSAVYAVIVGAAIQKHWRYPTPASKANLLATVEIVLDQEGKILSSKITDSSGNPEFDNSALRAIKETEYVERPKTERDRVLRINFNSQELSE